MGTTFSATRAITSEDIATCARLTGDIGSHHVSGLAGKQMAQGVLTLALAPLFMRDGVHMSELSIKFLAPVFAGDTITATVEIVDMVDEPDGLASLSCTVQVANAEGAVVLDGTAHARVPSDLLNTDIGATPAESR